MTEYNDQYDKWEFRKQRFAPMSNNLKHIKCGDFVAVIVKVDSISGGIINFKSDDGKQAYRRVGDVALKNPHECYIYTISKDGDTIGHCKDCGKEVIVECVIYKDGKKFHIIKDYPADTRTDAHPANRKDFQEISPNIWQEIS